MLEFGLFPVGHWLKMALTRWRTQATWVSQGTRGCSADVQFKELVDFLGGPIVNNPAANAESDSIPGLGGFHMPQSTSARAPQREKPPQ